jgi:hypothetical protein
MTQIKQFGINSVSLRRSGPNKITGQGRPAATGSQSYALSVLTVPSGGIDNGGFSQIPVIQVTPALGSLAVTASIVSGSGTLTGTVAYTNGSGHATFSSLNIDVTTAPAIVTLAFSASNATSISTTAYIAENTGGYSGSLFPNEPVSAGWTRVVDWIPTIRPYVNGRESDNGSGLVNYAVATYDRWGQVCEIVTDVTCPATSSVLRVKMPQDFYGLNFNGHGAAGDPARCYDSYRVSGSNTDTYTFTWGETLPSNPGDYTLFGLPGGVTGNMSVSTTGSTVILSRAITPSEGFNVSAGWGDQASIRAFGPSHSWDETLGDGHIYVGYYFKVSSGFTPVGSNGIRNVTTKHLYLESILDGDFPNARNVPIIGGQHDPCGANPARGGLIYTNQYTDSGNGPEIQFFNAAANPYDDPDADMQDGQWHLGELYIIPNTPGVADGVVRVYRDNVLIDEVTGVKVFGDRADRGRWSLVNMNNIYGGGTARCPADQYMYYGQIRVAVK